MASELSFTLGRRIRERREELGLLQGQLAAKVGTDAVNNQRISDWERGIHKPNDRHMADIAEALSKPVAWFYGEGDGETQSPDLMATLDHKVLDATQLDRIEATLNLVAQALAAHGSVSDPAGLAQALEDLAGQDEQHEREHEEDDDDDASEAQGG